MAAELQHVKQVLQDKQASGPAPSEAGHSRAPACCTAVFRRSHRQGHYSERSVHRLYTKMEGNTSHKENLDPVTPMQDPVISTNPVVIKKRAEMFLGGALGDKKKTKGILREEYEDADLLLLWIIFSTQLMAVLLRRHDLLHYRAYSA
ncbi:unnamed protein product [Parnassius apollo]|uniref:(apollo) hypothetical protein n=1 Tax=Parnassius apollo TaxID=110799 RepID=A0A8S3WES6_PARAO|nr:unnamed protein product [Parnassius apollo]CAG4991685.1 unnamed protein product [Parnassius apollo]